MKYLITVSIFIFFTFAVVIYIFKFGFQKENSISAYYNSRGGFAGFIQKKEELIRACEFSTNGTILSCSKWFDERLLKQGKNQGLNMEDISHKLLFQ